MTHHDDVTLRRQSLPGGEFAYYELGDPTAPLVVLQHGFPDHPKTFFPVADRLVGAGYRAVMPFLRGYAPSTLRGPFHQKRLGEDLVELSRALSPERATVLVGHDWGATATYAAVAHAPRAFRRAVTLAVPHVAAFQKNLAASVRQQLRSGYMVFFTLPFLPERIVPRNDFAFVDALWKRWS
ncbi:MAG TPA: alpha/beta fold hydrolase, partial [Polyangiaceae bacterium]|nr:alpha/beta fold hydrolase [Polyangiaceae bacterium]